MATDSSILAWEIPHTEEAGGLQTMGCKELDMTQQLKQQQQQIVFFSYFQVTNYIKVQQLKISDISYSKQSQRPRIQEWYPLDSSGPGILSACNQAIAWELSHLKPNSVCEIHPQVPVHGCSQTSSLHQLLVRDISFYIRKASLRECL